eukprot:Nk52_evm11s161 gene=Nk52_evmTU11s161
MFFTTGGNRGQMQGLVRLAQVARAVRSRGSWSVSGDVRMHSIARVMVGSVQQNHLVTGSKCQEYQYSSHANGAFLAGGIALVCSALGISQYQEEAHCEAQTEEKEGGFVTKDQEASVEKKTVKTGKGGKQHGMKKKEPEKKEDFLFADERVLSAYVKQLRTDDMKAKVLFAQGLCKEKFGADPVDCLMYYRWALVYKPRHQFALMRAARACEAMGNLDEAERFYVRFRIFHPDANFREYANFMWKKRENIPIAKELFDELIKVRPSLTAYLAAAQFYWEGVKDKVTADKLFQDISHKFDRYSDAIYMCGKFLEVEKGDHDMAENYYKRSIKLFEDTVSAQTQGRGPGAVIAVAGAGSIIDKSQEVPLRSGRPPLVELYEDMYRDYVRFLREVRQSPAMADEVEARGKRMSEIYRLRVENADLLSLTQWRNHIKKRNIDFRFDINQWK